MGGRRACLPLPGIPRHHELEFADGADKRKETHPIQPGNDPDDLGASWVCFGIWRRTEFATWLGAGVRLYLRASCPDSCTDVGGLPLLCARMPDTRIRQ